MVVSDVMNQALRGCDSMASPKIWFNWTCLSGSFACPVFSPRRSSAFQLDWTSTRSMPKWQTCLSPSAVGRNLPFTLGSLLLR